MDLSSFLIGLLCGVTEAALFLTFMILYWQLSCNSKSVKHLWNRIFCGARSGRNKRSVTDGGSDEDDPESAAERWRKYEAELQAFTDTLNYSIEQAYGIGET